MVMAEAAFLVFSLLTLWLLQKWSANSHGASRDWLLVCVGLSGAYTQMIRTIGLSLVAAIILSLLAQRRLHQVAIVAASFAVGVVPQIWLKLGSGGALISAGYQSQVFGSGLAAKVGQVWTNLQSYANEMISNSIVPAFGPNVTALFEGLGLGWVPVAANVLILAAVAAGVFVSIRYVRGGAPRMSTHTMYVCMYVYDGRVGLLESCCG